MGVPYAEQLAGKQTHAEGVLAAQPIAWEAPSPSAEEGFRTKAKMVVGGTVDAPTLGILDARQRGVDLRGCGVLAPGLRSAVPAIADFVTRAGLEPYDVPTRRGELKLVLLTESPVTAEHPEGELMLRFVLRSREAEARIRKHLPALLAAEPRLAVVSLNLLPEHVALTEGEREIALTERTELGMPLRLPDEPGGRAATTLELHLRPGGFFQTNTAIAAALYAHAAQWLADPAIRRVADLYSGVGGFALAVAGAGVGAGAEGAAGAPPREVVGVESSAAAVDGARRSIPAELAGRVRFEVADAPAWAADRLTAAEPPDAIVVNPPRRGLGPELAALLERSGPGTVLYSSCNVDSLGRDLAAMPSYRAVRGRLFDMFPQTAHAVARAALSHPARSFLSRGVSHARSPTTL
ncbi:MAG: methyltransferase domain-containing protein [Actinomycetales bacterium]|nr:methyltransferase domain-containing protein [Actinomycetales bacterium]